MMPTKNGNYRESDFYGDEEHWKPGRVVKFLILTADSIANISRLFFRICRFLIWKPIFPRLWHKLV